MLSTLPLTFIAQVEFGQVVSIVGLLIHGAALSLFICAQIHGLVLHLLLSEEKRYRQDDPLKLIYITRSRITKGTDDKVRKKLSIWRRNELM